MLRRRSIYMAAYADFVIVIGIYGLELRITTTIATTTTMS